ncbi:uncharacterized protein LOC143300290 [Babylonia areolata]|uniref:uncharacterized protein LOC143300290 n=1 Tax=Babylonia areolata TaxID=304850 RepID=UPI003FCFA4BF
MSMEKQTPPLNNTQDVTLAAYGLEHRVDDKTIFCTPDPQAASTVSREQNRLRHPTTADSKGSFLDDMSRLSLQSASAMDLTSQLRQLNFTLTTDGYPEEKAAAVEKSGPDLIQFSGNTDVGISDQETNKSDSLTDTSSRSSMGLIPADMLNDCDLLKSISGGELSASVLPLSTPKAHPVREVRPKEMDPSHSTLREKTTDSKDWSDSSTKQDSKQDSKDMPCWRSQVETVKKRPKPVSSEGRQQGLAARGAVALFAGHLLDDVVEGEELDQSVHCVELGEDDLKQLDAGVDFSDLEEDRLSGRESGDEDFDFDEPLLSLPTRGRMDRGREEEMEDAMGGKTLQAELAETESRVGEGQECEDSVARTQPPVSSNSDFGLDSRYFRKTPMSFAGDGEESEVASSRSSLTASNQQRGTAEGEHLLTKLRRQFMSGDGSENEIDTDDELEAVRKSLALSTRERGQGADEEDTDRSNLPLPAGLEDETSSDSGCRGNRRSADQTSQFFLTRQRAEGDVAHSPLPWDGGGDGSSGGDSDGGRRKVPASVTRPPFRYVSGASADSDQPVTSDPPPVTEIPPSSHTEEDAESGLQPKFFMPTSSHSLLQDSEVISPHSLEGSTFHVEDILKPAVDQSKQGTVPRTDVSGVSGQDVPENPFEDQFASSFGSFGLGPAEEEVEGGAADRSAEKGGIQGGLSRDVADQSLSHNSRHVADQSSSLNSKHVTDQSSSDSTDLSAKTTFTVGGMPSKGSGSFDGPFRKPRAPAPPRKKADRKETYTANRSETWKSAAFQGTDVKRESNLERELRELGISVNDDDFQFSEGAQAMLDADEQQFEEENKFSEHHQLALAAEGLAWEGEDSCFSGFLGGDEHPEHLETSIGTYMAARTETLGTLGGDPRIPRPEFGKPVSSPPRRSFPVKLMSPPSTSSSILSSRTEGEGDEEGDRTMVSGDNTLSASGLVSPSKSPGSPPSSKEQQPGSSTITGTRVWAEDRAAAEDTLRGELSSMLLDMTQGGGDLTMEEALSNSAVLDFLRNHSYSNANDFVSAIMKLSHTRKGGRREGERAATTDHGDSGKGGRKEATRASGKERKEPPTTTSASVVLTSSSSSPHQQGSMLPVRVGAAPFPIDTRPTAAVKGKGEDRGERTTGHRSAVQGPDSAPRKLLAQKEDRISVSDDFIHRQPADRVSREAPQSRSESCRMSASTDQLLSQNKKSGQVLSSLSGRQQSQGSLRKKTVSQVRFEHDQADSHRSPTSNPDYRVQSKADPERKTGPRQSSGSDKQDQHSTKNKQNSDDGVNALNAKTAAHAETLPLNIPGDAGKERAKTKEQSAPQKNDSSALPDVRATFDEEQKLQESGERCKGDRERWKGDGERWKDGESFGQQHLLRTPPQRLPTDSQPHPGGGTQGSPRPDPHPLPSTHMPSTVGTVSQDSAGQSRPTSTAGSHDDPASQGITQRPSPSPYILPPASTDAARQPTLLTGSSLLRTEFVQKYLTPAVGSRAGADLTTLSSHHYLGLSTTTTTTHIPPDHLPPEGSSLLTPRLYCWSQARPQPGGQGMDESGMSGYHELKEDMEQSTVLGVEGSALGSFWGKSPLYQSTPTLEVGKVAAVSMLGSRLDEQELNTPGTNMVTPRIQRQLIQIQRAMDFQEFCCLGVSQKTALPVTNRTAYGVTCRFRLVRLLHNANPIKLDQQSPFELKPKISIGAGATENVPVLFVPKRPGEHVCEIEVYAQSLNPTLEPTVSVVQLRATAEVPTIQFFPSVEVLEMGEVAWGGCVTRTIKLRNVKKASLPVRLSLWSGTSVWHCFTFDSCDTGSDLSIISMASRPESLGRNVVTVILPGCDSPDLAKTMEITLYCRPPHKEHSRALAQRPAEEVDAKIDIEVDTPVRYLHPLASILLKAKVGLPRLLIPTSNMSLTFRAKPQESSRETVTVNNAGNITLHLALSVATFPECFRLSDLRLAIKPGGQEQVELEFSPHDANLAHYQSLLQLDVEPEGLSYEIPLEGKVTGIGGRRGAPLTILTTKSFLAFHGVSLNQTRSLTVKLYNKDNTHAEHACVEVRQSADCFKLVSASGEWQQRCDVVIEPRETITLTVIFCPTAVQGYSGKLVIRKPDAHSSKYSIRLAGYGGGSVMAVSGACLTNSGQRWLELGALSLSHNIMKELVLTNTGVRAAFVRAAAFCDMPCRQPVAPGRVAVEPNSFVLAPGCSMRKRK